MSSYVYLLRALECSKFGHWINEVKSSFCKHFQMRKYVDEKHAFKFCVLMQCPIPCFIQCCAFGGGGHSKVVKGLNCVPPRVSREREREVTPCQPAEAQPYVLWYLILNQ